ASLPNYLYLNNRHYREMHARYQAQTVNSFDGRVISAGYDRRREPKREFLCTGLHFKGRLPFPADVAVTVATVLTQAQNLDRDVIRAAAVARQFDKLAASLFRAFIFHCIKNLRVAHQPPQSVAANQ